MNMAPTVPSVVELTSVTVAPCKEIPCLRQIYATPGNEGSEKMQQTTALSSKCKLGSTRGKEGSKNNRVDIGNGTMVGVLLIKLWERSRRGLEWYDRSMRCYVI